jgi:hypothetical protein
MAFSATLAPPTGLATDGATKFVGRSGATYTYDGSSHIVVAAEVDYMDLVKQGWSVVSVTR